MQTIASALAAVRPSVAHRVWICSDLQQADPAHARHCMTLAVNDFQSLALPCDHIWYLGDAVEGHRLDLLSEMVQMQLSLLTPLNIPLRYVQGNHDFDPFQYDPALPVTTPFWDAVKTVPTWKTTAHRSDFYFTDTLGPYLIVFFSDHTAADASWISTHGRIHRDAAKYPHTPDAYLALRDLIANSNRPVITAGHCPFAGGNRPSDLMSQMLPLPPNVRAHFYGHAHIGDHHWVKENVFRKIAYVHHQTIPQFDIASLENRRGNEIRSAFLEIYTDGTLGIFFRDHSQSRWAEALLLNPER